MLIFCDTKRLRTLLSGLETTWLWLSRGFQLFFIEIQSKALIWNDFRGEINTWRPSVTPVGDINPGQSIYTQTSLKKSQEVRLFQVIENQINFWCDSKSLQNQLEADITQMQSHLWVEMLRLSSISSITLPSIYIQRKTSPKHLKPTLKYLRQAPKGLLTFFIWNTFFSFIITLLPWNKTE